MTSASRAALLPAPFLVFGCFRSSSCGARSLCFLEVINFPTPRHHLPHPKKGCRTTPGVGWASRVLGGPGRRGPRRRGGRGADVSRRDWAAALYSSRGPGAAPRSVPASPARRASKRAAGPAGGGPRVSARHRAGEDRAGGVGGLGGPPTWRPRGGGGARVPRPPPEPQAEAPARGCPAYRAWRCRAGPGVGSESPLCVAVARRSAHKLSQVPWRRWAVLGRELGSPASSLGFGGAPPGPGPLSGGGAADLRPGR